MVDLFAGLLSNAAYLTHVKSWVDAPDEPQNLGHFFLLIDTRRLGSTQWLAERMNDFADVYKRQPRRNAASSPPSPTCCPAIRCAASTRRANWAR